LNEIFYQRVDSAVVQCPTFGSQVMLARCASKLRYSAAGNAISSHWFRWFDGLPCGFGPPVDPEGPTTPLAGGAKVEGASGGPARTISVWGFAFVTYFIVAGGPFGIEVAVRAAGALPVMIGFLFMPFLFALPQVPPVFPCVLPNGHLCNAVVLPLFFR
jgi:hypothetical protein